MLSAEAIEVIVVDKLFLNSSARSHSPDQFQSLLSGDH